MIPGQRNFGKLFDLSGQVTLITGAGAGFGEALAVGFAEPGCNGAVADVNLDSGRRTAEKLRKRGRQSVAVGADVWSPDAIKAMVNAVVREFGRIDILVNSAGISQHAAALDLSGGSWDRVVDVNLRGTFLCC